MICRPCADQRHDDCEDAVRERGWAQWLREKFRGQTIGPKENSEIKANRPTRSCPCLHRVRTQPVDDPESTPNP